MIAILDYGVGNLFSLQSSLDSIGEASIITRDPLQIHQADRLILPGVGAFCDAIGQLKHFGLDQVIRQETASGKPLLGICLGMQLLFQTSMENGIHQGLGLIPGTVRPLFPVVPSSCKIPHIGWNQLHQTRSSALFSRIPQDSFVYFVHSYYAADCSDFVIATTDYGIPLTAAVACGCVYGCQFHPEKSGAVGLEILKTFCQEVD